MNHYETLSAQEVQGFEIVFSVCSEVEHPRYSFDHTIDDIEEICHKIDAGDYVWFIARVQAYRCGVLLANDYLCGCLYESYLDFMASGGYYDDMVYTVIKEAQKTLSKLAQPA
jgi:hypothetical protein